MRGPARAGAAGPRADARHGLVLLEIESGSPYTASFLTSAAPGWLADEPSVASWGFGPDPTRFVYAYESNAAVGTTEWGRVNVATGAAREDSFTANSMHGLFSPCGDAFASVVKQLATSDLTDVALYPTRNPLAGPHGSQGASASPRSRWWRRRHSTSSCRAAARRSPSPRTLRPTRARPRPTTRRSRTSPPPTGALAGLPVSFVDQSSDPDGNVVSWQWSFGDGATSSASNPSHTYAAAGHYRVRLTVADDEGDTDVLERIVSICGSLSALSGRLLYNGLLTTDSDDLFVLNAGDGSTVQLTNSTNSYSRVASARFSPDGAQIAYEERGYFLAGIWVMNADGSQRRRLTDGGNPYALTFDEGAERDPAWSPDGRRIAYTSDTGSGPILQIRDLESEDVQDLGVSGREPAWSPDGALLVYASDGGMRLLEVATGSVTDLTYDPSDASPAWRPGGGTVVFERDVEDGSTDLFEVDVASGFASPLVTNVGDDRDPAFAAVGEGFAYATQYGGETTILAAWSLDSYLTAAGENPSWSPDGAQIAFDHDGSILRIDPRSYELVTVSDSGSDSDPSWQPTSGVLACANGGDDDGDGWVDAADPTCGAAWPYWEAPPCGLGAELVAVLGALRALRRRSR